MSKEVQPEGNYYDKYNTKNPIEKLLMSSFFKTCADILVRIPTGHITDIIEIGCGEGHFTEFLAAFYKKTPILATDISDKVIGLATANNTHENISFAVSGVEELDYPAASFSLAVASEVLEHMDNPEVMLNKMAALSSEYVFITVPNEPLWRILNMARFKYVRRFGNTPGHVQHFSKRSLIKLCTEGTGLSVCCVRKSLPWLLILLRKN